MQKYLSFIKFSHSVFALPFALIGFITAIWLNAKTIKTEPTEIIFILFKVIACMVFARSAAMGFNRLADKEIDRKNSRTQIREIPSGKISVSSAVYFVIITSIGFCLSALWINSLCFYLSPVALLIILGYSFTKRFTWLSHFILGLGLSLSPIGAYIAFTGKFDVNFLIIINYSVAILCWVSGFDIIYSLQDTEFDRKEGLYSIPSKFGIHKALLISRILHLLTSFFLITAGYYSGYGVIYWLGTLIFISMLFYQHTLVKPNDLSHVNVAFFTTNGIASICLVVFLIFDIFISF
ncbi:MAG: 4-hydroxybenzoate octaprenyltransferase [Bacteroidetes bacterium RIFCSPLOWO2_02_FULL_36_8]|nr:MAG: 4-hydroxybenzoate octaprenyltransferase [Bacteroidetes bacterium RIFCSPLOWO2_02_FULL_36_8]OFY70743.1 MAG: 4-hydroxybenzoate octaprenyltransferase [Bacteroidetes bacterium RIFCSPLOWO2_12_FULL_37_12]